MSDTTGLTIFGVVSVVAAATTTTVLVAIATAASSVNWVACIEAGRSMVNGVCL